MASYCWFHKYIPQYYVLNLSSDPSCVAYTQCYKESGDLAYSKKYKHLCILSNINILCPDFIVPCDLVPIWHTSFQFAAWIFFFKVIVPCIIVGKHFTIGQPTFFFFFPSNLLVQRLIELGYKQPENSDFSLFINSTRIALPYLQNFFQLIWLTSKFCYGIWKVSVLL